MDDARLHTLRQDPSPDFAERLRARLRQQPAGPEPTSNHRWTRRLLWAAGGVAALVLLLSLPAVRASAQSFLALFRVVNFVAVPVDPGRLDALQASDLDPGQLIGDHVDMLEDPGPPVAAASPEAAGTLAGFDVRLPGWVPDDTTIIDVQVTGERVARVTADTARLRQVMDALGITDLGVPDGLDGQTATIRVPPVVMIRFEHGTRHTRLYQAMSPQITMPSGVNLTELGEIGLRILGVPPADAHQLALGIDWNTTLVVPLPPTARSFRPVDVAGHPGIAIQAQPPDQSLTNMILWSDDGRVYGLKSLLEMSQVLQIADSIQ